MSSKETTRGKQVAKIKIVSLSQSTTEMEEMYRINEHLVITVRLQAA